MDLCELLKKATGNKFLLKDDALILEERIGLGVMRTVLSREIPPHIAALIVALHNCAEELLNVVEAAEKAIDTPDHGYEKGLFVTRDRFDNLCAALAALRERRGGYE